MIGLKEITLFIFILSLLFFIKESIMFFSNFFSKEPKPVKIKKVDGALIYFAISYIITFLLNIN